MAPSRFRLTARSGSVLALFAVLAIMWMFLWLWWPYWKLVYIDKAVQEALIVGGGTGLPLKEVEIEMPAPAFGPTPHPIPTGARYDPKHGAWGPQRVIAPRGIKCLSLNAEVTGSDPVIYIGALDMVTDGDKEPLDGRWVELAPGPQWVQVDLGRPRRIWLIVQWHSYMYGNTVCKDVMIQLSNDPAFERGVTTVFNNDHDNTLGFGAGEDFEYVESAGGYPVSAGGVAARYVRSWSNGTYSERYNRFTEVEVWGYE